MSATLPRLSLEDYNTEFASRHMVHGTLTYWAERKPDEPAIIHHDRDRTDTWRELDRESTALAMQLIRLGFRKGDFLATSLPYLREHILLEYACFKIGVIHAPLDLRLSPEEVIRNLGLIQARGYVFLGKTRAADFRELGRAVAQHCSTVERLIQMSPVEETIDGAHSFAAIAQRAQSPASDLREAFLDATGQVRETDGAQVIFTTGSTGAPKPALLTHRSITAQNMCIGTVFFGEGKRVLVNLPPSHVGGQAELLMTTLFCGGTAVVLEIFDAAKSIEAMEKHRVNVVGQIPAMFHLEWRLSGFDAADLSSLETVVYGGQQVSLPFLKKMAAMAPSIGTGLGLTETSGFCTYTAPGASCEEVAAGIGHEMPIYPLTIRRPMADDGSAGVELPDGETGEICFRGPQTFAGYVNNPEATRQAISTDGVLYTGDLGYRDEQGLHFSGRSKWVIKPGGYQVFPGDVETHFERLTGQVSGCGVVGVEHSIFSEGIVAFVERKQGAELSVAELKRHARSMTSYMRPHHYVIVNEGELPLNRVAKTDYVKLSGMARKEVEKLREARKWDR